MARKIENPKRTVEGILDICLDHQKRTGFNITIRELIKALGLKSTSTGHFYIMKCLEAGVMEKRGRQFHAVERSDNGRGN